MGLASVSLLAYQLCHLSINVILGGGGGGGGSSGGGGEGCVCGRGGGGGAFYIPLLSVSKQSIVLEDEDKADYTGN